MNEQKKIIRQIKQKGNQLNKQKLDTKPPQTAALLIQLSLMFYISFVKMLNFHVLR